MNDAMRCDRPKTGPGPIAPVASAVERHGVFATRTRRPAEPRPGTVHPSNLRGIAVLRETIATGILVTLARVARVRASVAPVDAP